MLVEPYPVDSITRFRITDSIRIAPVRVPHPISIRIPDDTWMGEGVLVGMLEVDRCPAVPPPRLTIVRVCIADVVVVAWLGCGRLPMRSRDVPHAPNGTIGDHARLRRQQRIDGRASEKGRRRGALQGFAFVIADRETGRQIERHGYAEGPAGVVMIKVSTHHKRPRRRHTTV